MDACRELIKSTLSADEVYFTSGGTEANNIAILGMMQGYRGKGRVLYSAVEHSAVAESCRALSEHHEVMSMPVDQYGVLDLNKAEELMTPETTLICVMQMNNEVGSIQPIEQVISLRNRLCPKARIHVDGVQGFLKLPFSMRSGVDSYALSGHKIHGPKGIGALALRKNIRLSPIVFGGKQENGLRSGTENTVGIAGLKAATEHYPKAHNMLALKQRLYERIAEKVPEVRINGPEPYNEAAGPHILNLSFPPVLAQTLMHQLEGFGVLVSQGSACSSKQKKPSLTLGAMGTPSELANTALRFSLSCETTMEEIEQTAEAVHRAYESLRKYTRR